MRYCPILILIDYSFQTTFVPICFRGRNPRYGARCQKLCSVHLRFQTTCPLVSFVGRTHTTDTVPTKTDTQSKHKGRLKTCIGFSDDLYVLTIFVDRAHATELALPKNFVAREPLKIPTNNPIPLQNSFSPDNRNPNTGFRLFPLLIAPDFTQIPP